MTLLWNDSLDYAAGSTFLNLHYKGGAFNITSGQAHERPTKRAIATTLGILRVPHSPATGDTATVGFLMKIETASTPIDGTILIQFRTSGDQTKTRVVLRTEANGYRFEFQSPDPAFQANSIRLLKTSIVPWNTWHFLEFQVRFHSSLGMCAFCVDGTELDRTENLNSDAIPGAGWNHTYLTFGAATPALFRMADLYVLDNAGSSKTFTTFLGRSFSNKLYPGEVDLTKMGWGATTDGQYDLVIICGQSNADGLGMPPYTGSTWRSPNPSVPIWNTATNAWEPLNAATNAWGHLYYPTSVRLPYVGATMQFAERVAQLYEQSGIPNTTPVRVMQIAAGGSTVSPGSPGNSWHPTSAGGLFYQFLDAVNAGISALGGPSAIRRIHLFWYQGETETLLVPSTATFPGLFVEWTLDVLLGFAAQLAPIPITLNSVRIHKNMTPVFPFMVESIRARQELMAPILNVKGTLINVDDLPLSDGVHIAMRGLNVLGDRFFEVWADAQDFASHIRDESSLLSPDNRWLATATAGKTVSFSQLFSSRSGMVNDAVLAASMAGAVESAVGQTLETSLGGSIPLPNGLAWTAVRGVKQKPLTPEQAAANIDLRLS